MTFLNNICLFYLIYWLLDIIHQLKSLFSNLFHSLSKILLDYFCKAFFICMSLYELMLPMLISAQVVGIHASYLSLKISYILALSHLFSHILHYYVFPITITYNAWVCLCIILLTFAHQICFTWDASPHQHHWSEF